MNPVHSWDAIEEFLAVAETGSFTAAATRLAVSASYISRRIAALESRLTTRLFYRNTRSVRLTEAGEMLLLHCRRLTEERDDVFRALTNLQDEPSGTLRLTCAVAYGERFVVPLVNAFMLQYPKLSVDILLTNNQLDLVHQGLDLAIRLGRLSESSLIATKLAPRDEYLCASPDYLARHGTPTSLDDLAHHQCVIGSSETWVFHRQEHEWSFKPKGRWRCNSGWAVLDATLRGFGLAQLPDYYVKPHLHSGKLVSLLDAHRPPHTAVWAVYPQRRHTPAKVRLLLDHLKAGLSQLYQDDIA